jgi:L-histidine Nalpha-methyltransferase
MPSFAQVTVHPSQFPEQVWRSLRESLTSRKVNHKFHYDSLKQTQKWLALHQAYSPSRSDPDCAATYDHAFAQACTRVDAPTVHLVGLGCGGGQKDTRLLKLLQGAKKRIHYTPSDVSTAMVLVARQNALSAVPETCCHPLVLDLATANDLGGVLDAVETAAESTSADLRPTRLFTFFGMIPNFEPDLILPRLSDLVRTGDWLLFSANLAPGPDYRAGVDRVLPLYDNPLTRDWLMTFLIDLGVERDDGQMNFVVEEVPPGGGLWRIAAYFRFGRAGEFMVNDQRFCFSAGESIRLFFSYRHTPALARSLLARHELRVVEEWITRSEEEGVFLVARR